MRALFTFLIGIGYLLNVQAQNPNNHWILGYSDVNFTNNPGTASTVSNSDQYGCASYSDSSGNLLFYTNGIYVWNKNHQLMQNGQIGEEGSTSTLAQQAQPAIIVPYPNNSQKYYVFTTCSGYQIGSNTYPGASYIVTTVDFSNPSYPLGYVTLPYTSLNITLYDPGTNYFFRPLTYTINSAQTGYYVLLSNNTGIYRCDITSSGIATPVLIFSYPAAITVFTSTGPNNAPYYTGVFKFSPNRQKIGALVLQDNGSTTSSKFFTLDFNPATGAASNYTLVDTNTSSTGGSTDFEFSSDSQIVYFVRGNNIYAKNLANISAAQQTLNETGTSTPATSFNHIQRDKYGNILISSLSSVNNRNKYLHKIENQTSFLTSSVTLNAISLNGNAIPNAFTRGTQTLYHNYPLPQSIAIVEQSCQSLTLTSETHTGTYVYQNYSSITAQTNYEVTLGESKITMQARDEIVLKPNTWIGGKALFLGKIASCQTGLAKIGTEGFAMDEISENTDTGKTLLTLYPNPANNEISIETQNANITTIQIMQASDGRNLLEWKTPAVKIYRADVSRLKKGIYLVLVTTDRNETIAQKLIKN